MPQVTSYESVPAVFSEFFRSYRKSSIVTHEYYLIVVCTPGTLVASIEREVHRNPADDCRVYTADDCAAAIGQRAPVAIMVANRNCCHQRLTRRLKRAAIADGFPLCHPLEQDDAGVKRHYGWKFSPRLAERGCRAKVHRARLRGRTMFPHAVGD